MHLLIIILQQLLGLMPSGEGKKAPQVELARAPRQNPHGSESSSCLRVEFPYSDRMTVLPLLVLPLFAVVPVACRVGLSSWRRFRPPRLQVRSHAADESIARAG